MVSTDCERARRAPAGRATAGVLALVGATALGCASPWAEPAPSAVERWEAVLLDRAPLSPGDRTREARSVLADERWARVEKVHHRALRATSRILLRGSPQKILKGLRSVVSAIWKVRRKGDADERALLWLEPGLARGLDDDGSVLYESLREGERTKLAKSRLARARAAIDEERFDVARQLLVRCRQGDPESDAVQELSEALAEREAEKQKREPMLAIRSWDLPLAETLLAEDFAGVLDVEAVDPEVEFVHAAAEWMLEDRSARERLLALSSREGPLGDMAAEWLDRPDVNVEGELDRAVAAYRFQRALGFIGGNALAERGGTVSSASLSAWRQSLTLTNMGISLPARVIRGWTPDATRVREAALHYLDAEPNGPKADLAADWLDEVGWPKADALGFSGEFQLPAVQSAFDRVAVAPVIVSRTAIKSALLSPTATLLSALEGSPAVRLEARRIRGPESLEERLLTDGFRFSHQRAQRLIDELASGIESGALRFSLESRDAALERLRRIDAALERGWVLFAEAWTPPPTDFVSSFRTTAIDGTEHRGNVGLARGEDDLLAVYEVGNEVQACPDDVLCIHRASFFRTVLYGYLDVSRGAGFGFQSTSDWLGTGIGLTDSGPEVALALPIGKWLFIDRWLPVELRMSIGGASPYIGPVLRRKRCSDTTESPDSDDVESRLPLGLGSNCIIRLY